MNEELSLSRTSFGRTASRTLRSRNSAALLWSARYPCLVSVPDSPPVLSLPGALAFTTRQGGRRNCRRPAPSSPAFPGSTTAGMPLGTPYPRGPAFVPGPSRFPHSRDTATYLWYARYPCQVTVSGSPPGLTHSRSAGSFASRCGWDAWSIPTSPGSILTGHSWFNYDGGA